MDVKEGDTVEKGQTLGRSGTTGLAGGDHLHFTMLVGGVQVNPVEWWDPHWMEDRVFRKIREAGGTAPAPAAGRPIRCGLRLAAALRCGAGCWPRPRRAAVAGGSARRRRGAGVDPATAGTVRGRVTLDGTPSRRRPPCGWTATRPARRSRRARARPTEHVGRRRRGRAGQRVRPRDRRARRPQSFPVPQEPVVLDQQKCWYVPRVVGVRVGQPLQVLNSDPLLHNVRANSTVNEPFNQGQPVQGMRYSAHLLHRRGDGADEVRRPRLDERVDRRGQPSVLRRDRRRRRRSRCPACPRAPTPSRPGTKPPARSRAR